MVRARYISTYICIVIFALAGFSSIASAQNVIRMTQADNHKRVSLNRGDVIEILLPANQETGFSWKWLPVASDLALQPTGVVYRNVGGPPGHWNEQLNRFTVYPEALPGLYLLSLVYENPSHCVKPNSLPAGCVARYFDLWVDIPPANGGSKS